MPARNQESRMPDRLLTAPLAAVEDYFQRSHGQWHSQRRYYTLKSGDVQEVISTIGVTALTQGDGDLLELAALHQLDVPLLCGACVTWHSEYQGPEGKTQTGRTVFGVLGDCLYRDSGFATRNPVVAQFQLSNPDTLTLRSEYGGSSFEEECRLIGQHYRTRQTIISRAGEEIMIGQYLEQRLA
ncbi:phycobiliprotein lyase [Synechococcus elongatus]|uniref:phycobiliprotein lyase n=1 Tax=Synechococcus elongatus TaxID=32046 RepID=UPI000F7E4C16|nr:phycobiliprotein lyase [Synechococcus elongatus]